MKTSPNGASGPLRPEDFVPPAMRWWEHIEKVGGPHALDKCPGGYFVKGGDESLTYTMSGATLSACFAMVAHYALAQASRHEKRSMRRDHFSLSAIAPLVAKAEVRS